MQNLPDRRVNGSSRYLQGDCTVTGLTQSLHESQGKNEGKRQAFPSSGRRQTGLV
jgi:hypothetical protein